MTRYRLDVDPEGWTVRPRTRQTRKEPTMSIPSEEERAMNVTHTTRIDEIRERLNKARPGLGEIDGGEELQKRRGNPKGSYTWTLYGTYADAILLVNARNDLAWCLGEIERLSARIARSEPRYHARTMALIKIRGLARQAGLTEIQGLANESLTTTINTEGE